MSTLGFYQDSPHKIENEGREIAIKLQKTSPSTAKVTWNLPKGAPGCSVDDLVYNGMVVVADTVPIRMEQTPTNRTYYTGDPTVDRNLHAGDRIGSGLVIGAFYDDKTTLSLDISGLQPNVPYYVAGFAVDNVGTYHTEGVHTYSQDYQEPGLPNTAGYQTIQLGVQSTALTGLGPGKWTRTFNICIDGIDYTISVNGTQAITYQELVDMLNYSLATLNNPFQGNNPPGYGTLYVDPITHKLYAWNGHTNVELDSIVSGTSPTMPVVNDLWLDTILGKMKRWSGIDWIIQPSISFKADPTVVECGTYWFNGTNAFQWDGTIWKPVSTINQSRDPALKPALPCGSYWLNTETNTMYQWKTKSGSCIPGESVVGSWVQVNVLVWDDDPRMIPVGNYWYDTSVNKLKFRAVGQWQLVNTTVIESTREVPPLADGIGSFWYNPTAETLHTWNGTEWISVTQLLVVWYEDPMIPSAGDLYLNDNELFVWDILSLQWKLVSTLYQSHVDPAAVPPLVKPTIWFDGVHTHEWDGMRWIDPCIIEFPTDPMYVPNNTFWYNTTTKVWMERIGGVWTPIIYIEHDSIPSTVTMGQYWFNPITHSLAVWNGVDWIPLMFQSVPFITAVGTTWYSPATKASLIWTGGEWKEHSVPFVRLDEHGNLLFTSGTKGSKSTVVIKDSPAPMGLFVSLFPAGRIQPTTQGTDGLLPNPSYMTQGVGTDGSSEERREMAETILLQLGYPTIQVELTKQQLEFCIDQGLQTLRRLGSAGYERAFFFMNFKAGLQHYTMTDQTVGFHKIVSIMGMYRTTSAFLGTAEGQGVYGQVVLQHLYSMGTFDLVSYHIINEYVELMEKLFAGNIMYTWREKSRTLSIHQNIWRDERVLVDAVIERTEQDILSDRYLNNWIQTWATSEACQLLAEIRGKFSTLPGAGGGITLNAVDLRTRATEGFNRCIQELDDYIVNRVEDYGLNSHFIMG
jgi:hypothetical protein